MKKIILFAAALAAAVAGIWLGQSLLYPAPEEPQRQDFRLPDMQGQLHNLSEWNNKKVVVLNFWATWCPPCREEIPAFIEAQKRHGAQGLQIIGVAVDNLADVQQYYKDEGMNYPVLIGEDDALNIMADFGGAHGGLPYSVILDAQGKIVRRKLGALSLPELEDILAPYLGAHGVLQ